MELNLCLLGDRDSYYKDFDTNNSQKGEKSKSGDFHSDGQSALLKNNTENNNNDPVVGQKRPITNNDGDNNTPANFPCFQNPAQTVYDVEEDLETINQIDQEHQIHQNLEDAISEGLASIIKKNCSYESENIQQH